MDRFFKIKSATRMFDSLGWGCNYILNFTLLTRQTFTGFNDFSVEKVAYSKTQALFVDR